MFENEECESPQQYPMSDLSPENVATLEKNFVYHSPHGDQNYRYEQIRWEAKNYAELLTRTCPPSRELSLALTNLEQAVFWANAAIARNS